MARPSRRQAAGAREDGRRKATTSRTEVESDARGSASESSGAVVRRSRRRTGIFRALALAFPLCAMFFANVVLYALGIGVDTRLVVPSTRGPTPTYYLNPDVDRAYCAADLRGPEPRGFVLPKPAGLLRIVVLGESSVQGYPHSSELAFPRQLEMALETQQPARQVEVLNAGMVGISSLPLVDLVRQSLAAQPDILVVYAGHNEFYGVGGVASNATLSRLGMMARRYRLPQVLARGWGGEQEAAGGELVSRLPKQLEIPSDHPWVREVEATYERRLREIASICRRANVKLVLCSVASNLRDHSPLAYESPDSAAAAATKKSLSQIEEAFRQNRWTEAATQVDAALKRDPANAVLHYRRGECLERLERYDESRAAFVRARDEDPCRYRAPSSFREIDRRVAAESGAMYVDVPAVFETASAPRAAGSRFFLEHVHLTLEGHWLIARSIAQAIMEESKDDAWDEARAPSTTERAAWLDALAEDAVAAHALAYFLYDVPPFNRAVDAAQHRTRLEAEIERLSQPLGDAELITFAKLDNKSKVDDLVDALGRAYLNQGDAQRAFELFQKSGRRRPWLPNAFVFEAWSLQQLGRMEEARQALAKSRQSTLPGTPVIQQLTDQLDRRLNNP